VNVESLRRWAALYRVHGAAGVQQSSASLSWRIFWLTILGPLDVTGQRRTCVYAHRIELLERVVHDTPHNAQAPPLVRNVIRLAQPGGYLARANDPPPGNTVMWRGMPRLTDIQIGYELALKRSG
jgi:hypothetical protein